MKILHTSDLHIGQIIYNNYDRVDEHDCFFSQLEEWCVDEKPDALIVSGDIFDIQQPSAATKKFFNDWFVSIHKSCPDMKIVITAGNHDSASRIQADSAVWEMANTLLVGTSPAVDVVNGEDGWQDKYIVRLSSGYIIAMPYMTGERKEMFQSVLDRVAKENTDNRPVVMMGHLAVTGMDMTGHDCEIGNVRMQEVSQLGTGYDYLALGHIHKPQTLGYQGDCMKDEVTYPSGVARYSGSALHVSCDETYPHTVSLVCIEGHGGNVNVRQLHINELRHFYVLPETEGQSFRNSEEAVAAVKAFANTHKRGYFRLRLDYLGDFHANFSNEIYDAVQSYGDEIRFNPKHIWTGVPEKKDGEENKASFAVADLQQMSNPADFIEKTIEQYPGLDMNMVREAFREVEEYIAGENLSAGKTVKNEVSEN